ncbi:hypothetical protein EV421DRAFT_1740952 [Armillaria borealis]|uniref:Uncharacterized protein n=1 Tax=Armillaria borealis TaxID=47425 RepID=A0AA39J1B2_9AGAR|nr:hypothetical protein EV421DRAFT_1740952 [Armillaria borealis]
MVFYCCDEHQEAIGHIHQERASETLPDHQSARYTLESKDQENAQRAFGAIRVPLWWWCEYYGARSTFEKPGLAFAFNSGLSTPVPLIVTVSYVSGEQGYSLSEVLVYRHGMTRDGWNGVTNIPHDVLGDSVCAAAIYRHPASVALFFNFLYYRLVLTKEAPPPLTVLAIS